MICESLSFSKSYSLVGDSEISITITTPEVYDCTNIQLRLRSANSLINDWMDYAVLTSTNVVINLTYPSNTCYIDIRLYQCCGYDDDYTDPDPGSPDDPPCALISTDIMEDCYYPLVTITDPYIRPSDNSVNISFNPISIPKKINLKITQDNCDVSALLCSVRCPPIMQVNPPTPDATPTPTPTPTVSAASRPTFNPPPVTFSPRISIPPRPPIVTRTPTRTPTPSPKYFEVDNPCFCGFFPVIDYYTLNQLPIGRYPYGVPIDIDVQCYGGEVPPPGGQVRKPTFKAPKYNNIELYYRFYFIPNSLNGAIIPFIDGIGYDISKLNMTTYVRLHSASNSTEMRLWVQEHLRFFGIENNEITYVFPYTDLGWHPYDTCSNYSRSVVENYYSSDPSYNFEGRVFVLAIPC